jgi:DNA-directed RNA polymerase specialized sigma24 family protein
MIAYEESLKVYRDLKAVTDTAYEDGYKEAESEYAGRLEEAQRQKEEERIQKEEAQSQKEEAQRQKEEALEKQKGAIILLLLNGVSPIQISQQLNLPIEFIESLKSN